MRISESYLLLLSVQPAERVCSMVWARPPRPPVQCVLSSFVNQFQRSNTTSMTCAARRCGSFNGPSRLLVGSHKHHGMPRADVEWELHRARGGGAFPVRAATPSSRALSTSMATTKSPPESGGMMYAPPTLGGPHLPSKPHFFHVLHPLFGGSPSCTMFLKQLHLFCVVLLIQ